MEFPNDFSSDHGETSTRLEERKSLRCEIRRGVRKMAAVCGLCWALGVVVFGVVEHMHADVAHKTDVSPPTHSHYLALAVAGGSTYVTGVAGYWGSLHLEHGLVCVFSYVVLVSSIVEIVMGAIILTFSGKAIEQDTMTYVKNSVNEEVDIIFYIQRDLECCGSESSADWVESEWWERERGNESKRVVPHSCCRNRDLRHKECQEGASPYKSVTHPNLIHKKGCHSVVVSRRRGLLLSSGCVCCACGVAKLASFFAIHSLAGVIVARQHRLEELRGRLPASVRTRDIEEADSHYHRRLTAIKEATCTQRVAFDQFARYVN